MAREPAAIHRFPTVELLYPPVHTPAPSLATHHLHPSFSCSTLFPLSWLQIRDDMMILKRDLHGKGTSCVTQKEGTCFVF